MTSASTFKHGLCDCCGDPTQALVGCCIPGLLYSKTSYRLAHGNIDGHKTINGVSVGTCAIFYFCAPFGWILPFLKRTEIREKYGIQGSGFGDCCTAYCCPCCSLIQNEKEVIERTTSAVPVITEVPKAQEAMTYPPPQ